MTRTSPLAGPDRSAPRASAASRPSGSARLVVHMLERLSVGSLSMRFPDGDSRRFGAGAPHGEIVLHNWKVCEAAFRRGDIGVGETYIAGDWTTPDLPALMDVMVANRNAIEAVIYGAWWGRLLSRIRHLGRRNSRAGSRRNVHAHYDIGNAFYAEWLDSSMTYSSACFDDGRSAADASPPADFDDLPRARPGDRLRLGGFARQAARQGLRTTGITLSQEQFEWARRAAGDDAERPAFRICDYRDVEGRFDGIVSVEMFEAVGERYWPSFFARLDRCLAPGGSAIVQTITIAESLYDDYRRSSDFIQQYIFPGGMLASVGAFTRAAAAGGFEVVDASPSARTTARTLGAWRWRFHRRERGVCAAGFDAAFLRTWSFYLAYCAAAFRHANTDVVQFRLRRAGR